MIKDADELRMVPPLPERGPMTSEGIPGMGADVLILKKYLNIGMYNKTI